MHRFDRALFLIASLLILLPSAAYAQASIAGTVKDTSGAVHLHRWFHVGGVFGSQT